MKAAYEYYKHTTRIRRKTTPKAVLGSLSAGSTTRASVRGETSKPRLSAPEQTLMHLINSGQIGAFIAHHAPPADLY